MQKAVYMVGTRGERSTETTFHCTSKLAMRPWGCQFTSLGRQCPLILNKLREQQFTVDKWEMRGAEMFIKTPLE